MTEVRARNASPTSPSRTSADVEVHGDADALTSSLLGWGSTWYAIDPAQPVEPGYGRQVIEVAHVHLSAM